MGDREPLRGLEFDFLAVDGAGRLGVLSSAGYGPIPVEVLERTDLETERIETIKHWLRTGGSVTVGERDGDLTFWTSLSERGLYCFDWKHWTGQYLCVSRPTAPLMGAEAQLAGSILTLQAVSFAEVASVDFAELGVPQVP
jgi:hypothetical protein